MIFFTVRHSTFNIRYSILNSPRKLLEESEVVFEKQPQVAYLVLQQGDPFNTHTKSKSCVNRTVNPAIVKHCRVYHPATQDLNPAGRTCDPALCCRPRFCHIDFPPRQ